MDAQAFQDEVLFQAPPSVPRALLAVVSRAMAGLGAHERSDVTKCIQLTARLQSAGLETPQERVQRSSVPVSADDRPTPEMRLRSAQLTHQIETSVQAVRQSLFGQPSAPCAALPQVIKWMEGEVRHLYEGIAAWARALYQPLWDEALEPSPLAGEPGRPETLQRLTVLLEVGRAWLGGWRRRSKVRPRGKGAMAY